VFLLSILETLNIHNNEKKVCIRKKKQKIYIENKAIPTTTAPKRVPKWSAADAPQVRSLS